MKVKLILKATPGICEEIILDGTDVVDSVYIVEHGIIYFAQIGCKKIIEYYVDDILSMKIDTKVS